MESWLSGLKRLTANEVWSHDRKYAANLGSYMLVTEPG